MELQQKKILVADDEQGMCALLKATFQEKGFQVTTVSNGASALEKIRQESFDVVITDLKMPHKDGIAVLRGVKEYTPDTGVIIITAHGSIEAAVEAMRLGAQDFITKPFKLAEIELKVDKLIKDEPSRSRKRQETVFSRPIIGSSKHIRQIIDIIHKIADSKSAVLITGPTGTGKELVARAIHDVSSRSQNPFIALNCAALAPGVLESELFGHEKGAFTGASARRIGRFERANHGTLFLDEVGEIAPDTQVKLLRVLQEGEFERVGGNETIQTDVRIIAATNQNLRKAIEQGSFREDFYYRLNVFSLQLEPLKDRKEDIPPLVEHFLQKFREETGKEVRYVEDSVMELFLRYPWPGNIRELENVLERAVVLAEGDCITREELPQDMFFVYEDLQQDEREGSEQSTTLTECRDELESRIIQKTLEQCRWNKTKAAEQLGIKRTTLQYKIKKYGIS